MNYGLIHCGRLCCQRGPNPERTTLRHRAAIEFLKIMTHRDA